MISKKSKLDSKIYETIPSNWFNEMESFKEKYDI